MSYAGCWFILSTTSKRRWGNWLTLEVTGFHVNGGDGPALRWAGWLVKTSCQTVLKSHPQREGRWLWAYGVI